jgi:hypothetical protein
MLTRVLVLWLLVALSACTTEKLIGDTLPATEPDDEQAMLMAASDWLEGDWILARPFEVTLHFEPEQGTSGGHYRASCPDKCSFNLPGLSADLPDLPIELDRGEYELVGITSKGEVRGVLYTDERVFGMRFRPELAEKFAIDLILIPILFERAATDAP